MAAKRFDTLRRPLLAASSRRRMLGNLAGLLGAGTPLALRAIAADAKKKKNRKCRKCCRANGTECRRKSPACKPGNCLAPPFAIEARWSNQVTDHDTYLFVPNEPGQALPSPQIGNFCNAVQSDCELDLYPFTCVSQDATGPGDEVTTVRRLIAGRYEYWIDVFGPAPAGDLTVTLRHQSGRVIRSWSSPPNPNVAQDIGWHVFDLDGAKGSIRSIEETVATNLPIGAHNPSTDVCP